MRVVVTKVTPLSAVMRVPAACRVQRPCLRYVVGMCVRDLAFLAFHTTDCDGLSAAGYRSQPESREE